MSSQSIPSPGRRGRLSRAAEFDTVSQLGRSVGGRYLVLRYRRREDGGGPRVGWAVPRKVGSAVDRNAVKRRLREAVERLDGLLRPATDYVLIARPGIAPAAESQGFDWLCGQVEELLRAVDPEPQP
ncbi:MAG TPA: ribonuclease P protein component [Gaiellales bacterium]|nr:ribonuclease P protein component [Gaiellales bacterium]